MAEDRLSGWIAQSARDQRRLTSAGDAGELFAVAAEIARVGLQLDRTVVLSVEGAQLSGRASDALAHDPSDALRRAALAEPIAIRANSEESELVRACEGVRRRRHDPPSCVAERLALTASALGPIAPEGRLLAVLVGARDDRPIDALDRLGVLHVAAVVSSALVAVTLRSRLSALSDELRVQAVANRALAKEALGAPLSLTTEPALAQPFLRTAAARAPGAVAPEHALSRREEQVAQMLATGRTNREIAEHLVLSVETVKDHVARVARKLGASNRTEAAIRYQQLAATPDQRSA